MKITKPALSPNVKTMVRQMLLVTAGAVVMAVGFDLFIIPAKIAPGGISGISIILNHFTGWLTGITYMVLNIPMLVLGFFYLGRFRFLVRTLYVTLLFGPLVDLFAMFLPHGVTDDLLLDAIYGGIVGGIGMGFIYRGGTAPAGTSVITRIIQLKTGIPTSQIYLFIDGSVVIVAGYVFGWEKALYALITLYVWGIVADYVMEGPSVIRTAFIITDKAQPVADTLMARLGVGVTAWAGEGMFTHKGRHILFCTVNRAEVPSLKEVVRSADPSAFLTIGQGHQAIGGMITKNKKKKPEADEKET